MGAEEQPNIDTKAEAMTEGGLYLPDLDYSEESQKKVLDRVRRSRIRVANKVIQDRVVHFTDIEKNAMQGRKKPWHVYDSSINSGHYNFSQEFDEVLDGCSTIPEYLQKIYGDEWLRVAEFGGTFVSGSRDLQECSNLNIDSTVGFSLVDTRSDTQRWSDTENAHKVIEANVFGPTFRRVSFEGFKKTNRRYPGFDVVRQEVQDNGKFHLVLERMAAPIRDFFKSDEVDPEILKVKFLKSVLNWYETAPNNGTLLITVCDINVHEINKLIKKIDIDPKNPIFESEVMSVEIGGLVSSTVRIRRLPGSPDKISLRDLLD